MGIEDLENEGSYMWVLGARISKEEKGAKLPREYIYMKARATHVTTDNTFPTTVRR